MALAGVWFRIERRRSLWGLVVVAVMLALGAGCCLAAFAGVRRADSAQARLAAVTLPADLLIAPGIDDSVSLEAVASLPEVVAADSATEFGIVFEGIPVASGRALSPATMVLPYGHGLLHDLERPVVLSGRLPDPSRPDEAAVTSGFVRSFGRGVGDVLHPAIAPGVQTRGDVALLPSDVRIVGVIRSPLFSDDATTIGRIALTPALGAIYRKIVAYAYAAEIVRLRNGPADVRTFSGRLQALPGGVSASVLDAAETTGRRQHVLDFENRFLLVVAGSLLLATLVVVGQAAARFAVGTVTQLQSVRGLGFTRRQIIALAVGGPAVAGTIAALAATAAAVALSPFFPLGSASAYEPDPGLRLDLPLLAVGLVVTAAIAILPALTAAWFAALAAERDQIAVRRSLLLTWMTRARVPVPALLGTRLALEPGTGAHVVATRSAQVGAIVGVLGVTAAMTFAGAVSEAVSNPARFGQSFQLSVPLSTVPDGLMSARTDRAVLETLESDPDVTAVNDSTSSGGSLVTAASATDLVLNRYQSRKGRPAVVLLSGRMPAAAQEAVLGPESAQSARVGVGDRVTIRASRGLRSLTVTGIGLVPESWRGSYAEGAWLTVQGYAALAGAGDGEHSAYVTIRSDVSPTVLAHRLDLAMSRAAGFTLEAPPPDRVYQVEIDQEPARVGEVRRVRVYPVVLGGLLALLAVAAVGHALVTMVRRRGHDLAVLRALGMTPRQSWAVVLSQAGMLGLIGITVGLPLGLVLGRTIWRATAGYTPLQFVPPSPWGAVTTIIPVVVVLSILLALQPGYRISRLKLAVALRTE